MAGLPSGTVTFLFTDIERSTETVSALGDERFADVLDEHRRLLREAFSAHAGHEMGTEGDSFFVAFARAHDAVAAAVAGQTAMRDQPLKVRMGLHTGEALVRADDYVGHDVHKAKRISDAGHGGQILLSSSTTELVADSVKSRDLGPHRLKDLEEPQRIHQVIAPGLDEDFPPLRSLDSLTTNLPPQRTAFVGREREIAEILELVGRERMITLTGVGGCGKTRLALQAGAELLDDYAGGVFFVDLAPLSEPDGIAREIAAAAGMPLVSEIGSGVTGATDERMLRFLSRRRCVIILDNCEHLLDACADIADRLLAECPDVVILATSREALDIDGEQSWRVPSLSLPDGDDIDASEAVSLFKARAHAVRPDFELTPTNIDAVVEICRRLDGIPLAIEFAASRVTHMSPDEIASRLGDMFSILAGGRRRRVQRQQTLQAALDWSYDLLSEQEQTLLRRLAVFAGIFRLEAVEGICTDDVVPRARVLELLGSLVAKSLVITEEHGSKTWYRLIETVRLYSADKLRTSGESDVFRSRHRDWYLEWVRTFTWTQALIGQWVTPELPHEHANLSAALERSEDEGRMDLMVSMLVRIHKLFIRYGNMEEGLRWHSKVVPEDLDIPIDEKVAALAVTGQMSIFLQRGDPSGTNARAFEVADGSPSIPYMVALIARSTQRAVASQWTRDPSLAAAARQDAEHTLEIARSYGPTEMESGLASVGITELILGDMDRAFDALREIKVNDAALLYLIAAAHLTGHHDRALWAARELALSRNERATWYIDVRAIHAVAHAGAGEIDEARSLLVGAIEGSRSGRPGGLANLMVGFATLAYLTGDVTCAAKLFAWARAETFDKGLIMTHPSTYAFYQHYTQLIRSELSPEDAHSYRVEGRALSTDEAIALAIT